MSKTMPAHIKPKKKHVVYQFKFTLCISRFFVCLL